MKSIRVLVLTVWLMLPTRGMSPVMAEDITVTVIHREGQLIPGETSTAISFSPITPINNRGEVALLSKSAFTFSAPGTVSLWRWSSSSGFRKVLDSNTPLTGFPSGTRVSEVTNDAYDFRYAPDILLNSTGDILLFSKVAGGGFPIGVNQCLDMGLPYYCRHDLGLVLATSRGEILPVLRTETLSVDGYPDRIIGFNLRNGLLTHELHPFSGRGYIDLFTTTSRTRFGSYESGGVASFDSVRTPFVTRIARPNTPPIHYGNASLVAVSPRGDALAVKLDRPFNSTRNHYALSFDAGASFQTTYNFREPCYPCGYNPPSFSSVAVNDDRGFALVMEGADSVSGWRHKVLRGRMPIVSGHDPVVYAESIAEYGQTVSTDPSEGRFADFHQVLRIDDTGTTTFLASIRQTGPALDQNGVGIYRVDASGSLSTIVSTARTIPGLHPDERVSYQLFGSSSSDFYSGWRGQINSRGDVAVLVPLENQRNPGVKVGEALLLSKDGQLHVVARSGQAIPGSPGMYYGEISAPTTNLLNQGGYNKRAAYYLLNNQGEIAFSAQLSGGNEQEHIFFYDRVGRLRIISARDSEILRALNLTGSIFYVVFRDYLSLGELNDNSELVVQMLHGTSDQGYKEAVLKLRLSSPTSCPADFNSDGSATVQDIFDFLTLWFAHNMGADFNRDSAVTVQDLFDFLNVWFGGC
jgi:hypothetical protein